MCRGTRVHPGTVAVREGRNRGVWLHVEGSEGQWEPRREEDRAEFVSCREPPADIPGVAGGGANGSERCAAANLDDPSSSSATCGQSKVLTVFAGMAEAQEVGHCVRRIVGHRLD